MFVLQYESEMLNESLYLVMHYKKTMCLYISF